MVLALVLVAGGAYNLFRSPERSGPSAGVFPTATVAPTRPAPPAPTKAPPTPAGQLPGGRFEIAEADLNAAIARELPAAPAFSSPLGELRLSTVRLALHPGSFVADGSVASPAGSLPLRAEGTLGLDSGKQVQMHLTDVRVSGAPAPAPVRDWLAGFAADYLDRAARAAPFQPDTLQVGEGKLLLTGTPR